MGDYKLILGYPGKYDGYTTDFSIGQTYLVDIMGLRTDEPESGEAHSDLFAEYLELIDGFAQLYNVMGELFQLFSTRFSSDGDSHNQQWPWKHMGLPPVAPFTNMV